MLLCFAHCILCADSLSDLQFSSTRICNSSPAMWRPLSSRSLFPFSLRSSPSSTTPSPFFVRPSHFSSSKTSSSKYAPYVVQASQFSPSKTSSSNAHSSSRQQKVKVMVWWDFDDCYVPTGVKLEGLRRAINKALEANGIRGPCKFNAIGNAVRLVKTNRGPSIAWSGYRCNHIANAIGGESRAYKLIIDDIMNWVSQNPPPAHLLLISGDEVFASVLEHLRMKNYNILIANNNRAHDGLCGSATIRWHLHSIVTGENLIGEHFNNPPHDSWYDHFKLPIEDGFSASQYSTSLNTKEGTESTPDSKFGPDSESVSDSRSVKVGVWWDHDNCNLPDDINLLNLPPALTAALRANGINGPIHFLTFGYSDQLYTMNVHLSGIDYRGEKPTPQDILDNIMNWVSRNPPPAHLLLISGNEIFASVLNRLRLKNYNIMIANNNEAPDDLYRVATIMWHWNSLARGEQLIGQHVNIPPHDSWYGHIKLPIEDDFSTPKYPTSLNTEEVSESAPDSKVFAASESVSESHSARVRVWWDLDNCNLPTGVDAVKIAASLNAALKANGINGPIEISAFGDDRHLSSANQGANFWTGIDFNFIPNGKKNDVFKAIVVDLMSWVSKNPPPAHLFLISGDEDFGGVLQRLRMKNYNILLACTKRAPDALCSAATIMWHWNSLVRGEKLLGNHFNYTIEESWYGNFKAPIEDALSTSEESTSLYTEEASK